MNFFSDKKNVVIAAVIAVLALGAGAFVFFSSSPSEPSVSERQENPEKYVRLALQNMYESLNIPQYNSDWVFDDIFGERHAIEFGVAVKNIDMQLPLDMQILSMLQLARLDADIVRDAGEMQTELNISVGGAPLFGTNIYMSPDELALSVPKWFDYYMTLDPKRATGDLNNSAVGGLLGGLSSFSGEFMDNFIYELYSQLFTPMVKPTQLRLVNDTVKLFENAEYGFVDVEDGLYRYSLLLKEHNFNEWYRTFIRSIENYQPFPGVNIDLSELYYFSVAEQLDIIISVRNDEIVFVELNTHLQDGVSLAATADLRGENNPLDDAFISLRMENPNAEADKIINSGSGFNINDAINPYIMIEAMPKNVGIDITHKGTSSPDIVKSEVEIELFQEFFATEGTLIRWDLYWDNTGDVLDNFRFAADILTLEALEKTGGMGVNMAGTVFENREKKELNTNFRDISWSFTDAYGEEQKLALQLKLNIFAAPDGDIGYGRAETTHITELSPLQLLQIFARLREDPLIGGFLQLP